MDGETQESSIERVRTPESHLSLGNSRLIERGIEVAESPKIGLNVYGIIVFESSVFVLTPDWDAHMTVHASSWNRTDTWKGHRRIVLFEFHQSGAFLRKITMPLIEFSAEGYSEIRGRHPGTLTIRSTFIHFSEDFEVKRSDWPQSRRIRVQTDYLFSRSGERRAVWSNGNWVDRFRHSGEPRVPTSWWLMPDWASRTRLIGVEERYESPQKYGYVEGAQVRMQPYNEPSGGSIVSQDVEAWVSQLSYSEHEALPNSMPREMHAFHVTNFPSVQGSWGDPPRFWQSHTRSDPDALWFFGEYPAVNESLKTLLWKVDMSVGTPRIVRYALPHPYDLMCHGIIEILDEEGKSWVPSVSDYDTVKQLYFEEAEFDFASPHWDGQYDSLYSWGENLIVTFGVHIWGGNAAHLLCKVEQDNLQPIKLTDAGFADVYELMEAHKITPHDNRNNSLTVGDLSWHYANNAFADGYLYSFATVRWRDLQLRNDIVVVKNVHTGHVSWFCPKVPDSYVEGVTVPHWDPYWDRLKST